eukprot:m.81966 g.81966  ORF g.81966 m.81966 type:complete len:556 (-) comp12843_c1_seq1:42-1709(-)
MMQEDFYEAVDEDDFKPNNLTSQQKQAFGKAGNNPLWYWPRKDRKSVEVTLQGKPDGTFVIRDSGSSKGDFVLSVSECNRVSHYVIQRTGPKTFVLANKTFENLFELLEFYKIHILADSVLCRPLPAKDAIESGKAVTFYLERVKTKYNFNARDAEDLSFRKGEELNIIEKHEAEWWKAQHPDTLEIGVIPSNYVTFLFEGPRGRHIKQQAIKAREQAERDAREAKERERMNKEKAIQATKERAEQMERERSEAEKRLAEAKRIEAEMKAKEERRLQEEEERRQVEEEQRLKAEAEERRQAAQAAKERAKQKAKGQYKPPERPKFVVARAIISRFANVFDKSALTFKMGDLIHVRKQHENGLWDGSVMDGKRCGRKGHFPFTFVDILDSAAFDEDTKSVAVAFQVAELKKQGVDVNKLVKKGVEAPPALPKRTVAPELPPARMVQPPDAAYTAYEAMGANDGGDYESPDLDLPNAAPPPVLPSRTYAKGNETPSRPPPATPSGPSTRAPLPPLPTSYDDEVYGEYDEQEDMIYGMAGDFDANAVEAMMEDIYGTA